jgi:hypothetical protein
MKRSFLVAGSVAVLSISACYVEREPSTASNSPQPTATAQPTYTTQPTAQPTYGPQPTATATPTTQPTYAPQPTATATPTGYPTTAPTGFPSVPVPGTTPTLPPTLALPGVCVPIGSWTKQFDNGLPASGTVEIGTPVLFNQFPVTDGVVVASAPVGTLKGTGAMTSTNDLSIDVTNGAIVASYTCKFSGNNCSQGTCTMTKGGIGGFKLVKR